MAKTQREHYEKGNSRSEQMTRARVAKCDEFYTKFDDVARECDRYAEYFRGKRILCPCDSTASNFLRYFETNFDKFGGALLTAAGFSAYGRGTKYVHHRGEAPQTTQLLFDGDFFSAEVLEIIKNDSDIVVTNPPFSESRRIVETLFRFEKQFLIVGNVVNFDSKEMEHLIMTRQLRFGYFGSGAMEFTLPDHYQRWMREEIRPDGSIQKFASVSSICWATNLPVNKPLGHTLTTKYDPAVHVKYDEHDAIEVPALKKIPNDYDGVMGVPVTFFIDWNPEQFDIVGFSDGAYIKGTPAVGRKTYYSRVFIKKR